MRPISVTVGSQDISSPIVINFEQANFKLGLYVSLTSGATLTYSIQHTADSPVDFSGEADYEANATWFNTTGLTGIIDVSGEGNIVVPVRAVRLNVTAFTDGSATLTVLQGS